MTNTEIYILTHHSGELCMDEYEDSKLHDLISKWNGKGALLLLDKEKFEQQYVIGHEENILCKVFKNSNGAGGIIAVFERSELLIVAYAKDNMSYLEGISHYAKMATYVRYGYDIFLDELD